MILFFDTETTGLPLFREPSGHPDQHRVCQLAMMLTNDEGESVAEASLVILPNSWPPMEEKALAVHGLTLEHCMRAGVPVNLALDLFAALAAKADLFVGFNVDFDKRMLRIEHKQTGRDPEWIKEKPAFCVMRKAQPIMDLAPTPAMLASNRRGPKPPSLIEAHDHFCGSPPAKSHDAMADVLSTRSVWRALKDMEKAT